MKNTGITISEQVARGRIALRDNTRALTSLLLLGLTRGCRVRWGAPGGRKPAQAIAPRDQSRKL